MKNIFNKKNIILFIPTLVLMSVFFVKVNFCFAQDSTGIMGWVGKNTVDGIVGSLARLIVGATGYVMDKVVGMIIDIAQYSSFVNNEQVKEGWTVVRDICNMFFILILLFIAFAVILRMESYSIKKSLPKLLIMAVLINFSRTICGIMIDFSQIVMLTFIGPITAGAGNFHNVLQIDEFLKAVGDTPNSEAMTISNAATYYVIAVVFMIVTTVVMIAVLISFVMRIVMFWVYIVLSPLAFLLSSFPGGQKYAGQFWGDFTKYLLNGPVLAFFLWLSLYVLGNLDTEKLGESFKNAPIGILEGPNFASFVMAIGMLVGGLTISAQIGGMGASWGSSTVSNLKNKGLSGAKAVGKRLSGYDAVADRAKAYMSMRRSARDDKIRADVGKIGDVVGGVKKQVARPFNYVASKTWGATGGRRGTRAKVLEEEIKKDRENIGKYKNIGKINDKAEFSDQGKNFSYDEKRKQWADQDGNFYSEDKLHKKLVGVSKGEIGVKEDEMKKLNEQQKKINTWSKVAMAGVGGAVGGALGLPYLAGSASSVMAAIYGAGVGGFGVPSIADDIKNAGKTDKGLLSSYEHTQVGKEGETAKALSTDENRNVMNDATKSIFKRMASALELISRKETNVKEVEGMRTDIASKFQDKTKAVFEGAVSRNYQGASDMFNFKDHPENQEKVRQGFQAGALTLREVDSDTLLLCGKQIAEGMKTSTFKKQYDDLSDSKKRVVKETLRSADSYEAREKIARIDTIDNAFEDEGPDGPERKKFFKDLSLKVIKEMSEDAKNRKSLANNIVNENHEYKIELLDPDIARSLMDTTSTAKAIRTALGVVENSTKKNEPTNAKEWTQANFKA